MLLSKLCLLDRGWSDQVRHHGTVCARKPARRVRHVPLLLCTYISKVGGRGGGNAVGLAIRASSSLPTYLFVVE